MCLDIVCSVNNGRNLTNGFISGLFFLWFGVWTTMDWIGLEWTNGNFVGKTWEKLGTFSNGFQLVTN